MDFTSGNVHGFSYPDIFSSDPLFLLFRILFGVTLPRKKAFPTFAGNLWEEQTAPASFGLYQAGSSWF